MTRALAFVAELVLWVAVALIATMLGLGMAVGVWRQTASGISRPQRGCPPRPRNGPRAVIATFLTGMKIQVFSVL